MKELLSRFENLTLEELQANKPPFATRVFSEDGYFSMYERKTGLFVRMPFKGHEDPLWSPHGPEIADVEITTACEGREFGSNPPRSLCNFCYMDSNHIGQHMSMEDLDLLIGQLKETPCHAVAMGGGNPNEHPQFVEILKKFSDANITPSYTTNGYNITPEILDATKKYCGAVAVSWPWWSDRDESRDTRRIDTVMRTLHQFLAKKIQTNIHFVLSNESIDYAIEMLQCDPADSPCFPGLKELNAIVFLLHKPVGRAKPEDNLRIDDPRVDEFLKVCGLGLKENKDIGITTSKIKPKWGIGFDSCSVPLLVDRTDTDLDYTETCESARFSIFITRDLKTMPCSFLKASKNPPDLHKTRLSTVWREDELFTNHRNSMIKTNSECIGCKKHDQCLGGCTAMKDIVMCKRKNSE